MTFNEMANKFRTATDEKLRELLSHNEIPATLADAMQYSVFAGGKRIRACLCLAACGLGVGDEDRAITAALPFACAIEMIHTYSLIHDDLPCMDDDDFRRGKPSSHKVFGEAMAVLAGDGLLSYAMEILVQGEINVPLLDKSLYYRAVNEVIKGAGIFGMIAGQVEDMANEANPAAGIEELEYIHSHKTGALISAAVLSGAIMGGLNGRELCAAEMFGRAFGRLFQITDDLLDEEGSSHIAGKTLGKDRKSQKLTYPALYGIDAAKDEAVRLANEAVNVLECFGERGEHLKEITLSLVSRRC